MQKSQIIYLINNLLGGDRVNCDNIKNIEKTEQNQNIKFKIFSFFAYMILTILLIITIVMAFVAAKFYTSSEDVPSIMGYSFFIINSDCMSPEINPGDLIAVKKCDDSELEKDKIIAFRVENFIIAHRIIDVEQERNGSFLYQTKADNNCMKDYKNINASSVVGVYKFKIPVIGNIFLFFKSAFGVIVIALIAVIWAIILLFI